MSNIKFIFPTDGDFVNSLDGKILGNGLEIDVKVQADKNQELYLNSTKMTETDSCYTAKVVLNGYRNALVYKNSKTGEKEIITVFSIFDDVKRYRISSDDNIIFLQDITKNKDKYTSIFENPYLAVYKKAHDLYGAKVHINLFYEFDDKARSLFSTPREYFNLSMMTDKFKDEFRANSDWLKLSFHAQSEFPDKPYKFATREKITEDCVRIVREIIRFAGVEVLTNTTTVHWGEANRDCVKGLRALGIKYLAGYFDPADDGEPIVSYYLSTDEVAHLHGRDFWYDKSEDIIFGKIDWVTNIGALNFVMDKIKQATENPGNAGFVSFMIHEQYFHSDYTNYLPDFEDRVLLPAKYLFEKGYTGAHFSDVVSEPNHGVAKALR